ncbi:hypothetical protein VaNZ11_013495 [Volvox africanus]|uniref:Uncharacterized protein n=1 Tax=Volvox africanus TaxID=51714 RepID=A0ABQ5SG84_9CHLO|nr:hypothetical protein VaNZ11_013495 [Volvox africanus]
MTTQPPAAHEGLPPGPMCPAGYVWSERLNLSGNSPGDVPANCTGLLAVGAGSAGGGYSWAVYAMGLEGQNMALWEMRPQSAYNWSSQRVLLRGVPPPARRGHALALSKGSLFVVAGGNESGHRNDIFLFNIHTSSWSMVAAHSNPVPPRSGHAVCAMGPRIYILGGEGNGQSPPLPARQLSPQQQYDEAKEVAGTRSSTGLHERLEPPRSGGPGLGGGGGGSGGGSVDTYKETVVKEELQTGAPRGPYRHAEFGGHAVEINTSDTRSSSGAAAGGGRKDSYGDADRGSGLVRHQEGIGCLPPRPEAAEVLASAARGVRPLVAVITATAADGLDGVECSEGGDAAGDPGYAEGGGGQATKAGSVTPVRCPDESTRAQEKEKDQDKDKAGENIRSSREIPNTGRSPTTTTANGTQLLGDVWCLDLAAATLSKVHDEADQLPSPPVPKQEPPQEQHPPHPHPPQGLWERGQLEAQRGVWPQGGVQAGAGPGSGPPAYPARRKGHSATCLGGTILVFGGEGADGSCLGDLWRFDPRVGTWIPMCDSATRPVPRANHATVALSPTQMLLFGGRDSAGRPLGDVWVLGIGPDEAMGLRVSDAEWLQLQVLPGQRLSARYGHSLVALPSGPGVLLYSFGGFGGPSGTTPLEPEGLRILQGPLDASTATIAAPVVPVLNADGGGGGGAMRHLQTAAAAVGGGGGGGSGRRMSGSPTGSAEADASGGGNRQGSGRTVNRDGAVTAVVPPLSAAEGIVTQQAAVSAAAEVVRGTQRQSSDGEATSQLPPQPSLLPREQSSPQTRGLDLDPTAVCNQHHVSPDHIQCGGEPLPQSLPQSMYGAAAVRPSGMEYQRATAPRRPSYNSGGGGSGGNGAYGVAVPVSEMPGSGGAASRGHAALGTLTSLGAPSTPVAGANGPSGGNGAVSCRVSTGHRDPANAAATAVAAAANATAAALARANAAVAAIENVIAVNGSGGSGYDSRGPDVIRSSTAAFQMFAREFRSQLRLHQQQQQQQQQQHQQQQQQHVDVSDCDLAAAWTALPPELQAQFEASAARTLAEQQRQQRMHQQHMTAYQRQLQGPHGMSGPQQAGGSDWGPGGGVSGEERGGAGGAENAGSRRQTPLHTALFVHKQVPCSPPPQCLAPTRPDCTTTTTTRRNTPVRPTSNNRTGARRA